VIEDDDLDLRLRAALEPVDLPAGRIAAVRARAHEELRRSSVRAERWRRAFRTVEASATFALGAAQVAWAIVAFLDRP
jgi:hypothetical protein